MITAIVLDFGGKNGFYPFGNLMTCISGIILDLSVGKVVEVGY